jgi:hypothetical protein
VAVFLALRTCTAHGGRTVSIETVGRELVLVSSCPKECRGPSVVVYHSLRADVLGDLEELLLAEQEAVCNPQGAMR